MNFDMEAKVETLIRCLDMLPVVRSNTFKIDAVNAGYIKIQGMINNSFLHMDTVDVGDNVETRWTIQKMDIHFVIFKGLVDLHFKLNDNIYIKHLSKTQSLRIPSGVPFMLKTYEKDCSFLLISSLEN